MAKMSFEQKRQRAREIENEIEALEEELRTLFEPQKQEEKPLLVLPRGFSITDKVFDAIKAKSEGISKTEIIDYIKVTHVVELSPGQVQSAVSYLSNQQKIEIIGRAVYRLKQ